MANNTRASKVDQPTKKAGGRPGNDQAYTRGRGRNRYKHCDNGHSGDGQEKPMAKK